VLNCDVCDVTECCVVACVMSAPVSPAVFKCGEAAHRHMVTTSRRACRVPQATVSQRRRRVAVRAPTELGFAAAFQATSARPQRRYAVEQPTADGNETWLTRFLAAAMARRSKEAIRRASASTKPTFTKNRDRLQNGEVFAKFMTKLLNHPQVKPMLSDEHFSVDGTLIEAWASHKSFRPKDGSGDEDGGANFHGQQRKNDTHASTSDPDSRLYRKAAGREAKLC
jgi:hypothetical protein